MVEICNCPRIEMYWRAILSLKVCLGKVCMHKRCFHGGMKITLKIEGQELFTNAKRIQLPMLLMLFKDVEAKLHLS